MFSKKPSGKDNIILETQIWGSIQVVPFIFQLFFSSYISQEGRGRGSPENRTWRDSDGVLLFDLELPNFPFQGESADTS